MVLYHQTMVIFGETEDISAHFIPKNLFLLTLFAIAFCTTEGTFLFEDINEENAKVHTLAAIWAGIYGFMVLWSAFNLCAFLGWNGKAKIKYNQVCIIKLKI